MPASVYLKPSLTLSIPKSSITLTLDPSSTAFSSDSINIEVGTNNASGYKLYVSTENNNTDLVNTIDNTKTIQTLSTSTPESSFPVNNWGYKLNSGNYLPFTSGALVNSSTGPVNSSATTFTVGAKVDYTKDAGTYQTNLQFNTVPEVAMHYMQDLQDPTLAERVCTSDAPTMVMDKRDEQVYTIRRIQGTCWMTANLRLGLNISNPDSTTLNLSTIDSDVEVDTTMTVYDLVTYRGSGGKCDSDYDHIDSLGYTTPCMHSKDIEHGNIGIWYNYAAASAGTIAYPGTSTVIKNATYSICPKGWTLPNENQVQAIGDTTSTYVNVFTPVYGGNYIRNVFKDIDTRGTIWSSAAITAQMYLVLGYTSGELHSYGLGGIYRPTGRYVRCVLRES